MGKVHINSKGEPAPCRATKRQCRFGEHFESMEAAHKYLEGKEAQKHQDSLKSVKREEKNPVGVLPKEDAFLVEDNWGDHVELTDPYGEDVDHLYMNGQCLAYSMALQERKGGKIYVVEDFQESEEWDEENDAPFEEYQILHSFLLRDDEQLEDIEGSLDRSEVEATIKSGDFSTDSDQLHVSIYDDPHDALATYGRNMVEQDVGAAHWVIASRTQKVDIDGVSYTK